MPAYWGQLGDIKFLGLFSPDFDSGVQFEKELIYHEHQRNGNAGLIEPLGIKAEKFSFRVRLSSTFIDDIDITVQAFYDALEDYEAKMFMVGDYVWGDYFVTKINGFKKFMTGGVLTAEFTIELIKDESQ